MVAIESMKERAQTWHVDTPIPHVYVNLLYLTTGPSMTQFMAPFGSPIGTFEELPAERKKALLESPFNPLGDDSYVAPVWVQYIKER